MQQDGHHHHVHEGQVSQGLPLLPRTLAAGTASAVATMTLNPLDVLKSRLQAEASMQLSSSHLSSRTPLSRPSVSLGSIIRQEGVGALWRGTSLGLMMQVPLLGIYLPAYDSLHCMLEGNMPAWLTPAAPLLAGTSARALAVVVTAPIELLRTRAITTPAHALPKSALPMHSVASLLTVSRAPPAGPLGCWAAHSLPHAMQTVTQALPSGVHSMQSVAPVPVGFVSPSVHSFHALGRGCSSSSSYRGSYASAVAYSRTPTLLHALPGTHSSHGMFRAHDGLHAVAGSAAGRVRGLVQRVGFMWTGVGATLAKDVPFAATYWSCMEGVRHSLMPGDVDAEQVTPLQLATVNAAAAAISASASAAITQPADVVKTYAQYSADPSARGNTKFWQAASMIYRQGGVQALFAGLGPRTLRCAATYGLLMSSYEFLKLQWLQHEDP